MMEKTVAKFAQKGGGYKMRILVADDAPEKQRAWLKNMEPNDSN